MTLNMERTEKPRKPDQDNIAYIRQMLGELRMVAKGEGADVLCYFIEMAYVEAGDIQNGRRPLGSANVKGDKAAGVSA
ncbi:hypothetical protein [Rhizobium sp. L1K21]|uniref:hypothetical protein n=1 Tax=Rhizobium sp. L1K21 TaxID=2954933 RepID=UPI002092E441|nr:hypothetical protein [Rhizobium sp. L1K21]MCO6186025.1 hypothetical protein [Rhizobium sp. L1K21]